MTRREFVKGCASAAAVAGLGARPARAVAGEVRTGEPRVLDATAGPIDLRVARTPVVIGGRRSEAVTLNGSLPAPTLRLREGSDVELRVHNALDEDTSVHWHGVLVPNGMDGVPKVNFPGIHPGETFVYRFPVRQYGTYWYHSHSAFQEQLGHYGPIIIDPAKPAPFAWDREHVVVLSDWTFENPDRVFAKLKKQSDYYNFQRRTVGDFFRDARRHGLGATVRDRLEWGRMRMDPTDLSDVTGATYTFLANGRAPGDPWTALFERGERVLLRFINAGADTMFDVRIPGLAMKIVEVSGQWVEPVPVEEFRIANAETYVVLVEPRDDRAYAIFAETIDRSGFALAALAPRDGMPPPIPDRRRRPVLTMADMGMSAEGMPGMPGMSEGRSQGEMPGMQMGSGGGHGEDARAMSSSDHDRQPGAAAGSEHAGHGARQRGAARPPGSIPEPTMHGPDTHGPGNAMVPMETRSRLSEQGIGLGGDGWRVLSYAMIRALERRADFRAPDREIELHLTGNMERFMWSMDGVKASDAKPIPVSYGERIRLTLVNDTMMSHPMHLHGMWMELENGHGDRIPRVHTVNVKPAERLSLLFTADAAGPWAFHCHILYHMEAGMFRVVRVSGPDLRSDRRGPEAPGDAHR